MLANSHTLMILSAPTTTQIPRGWSRSMNVPTTESPVFQKSAKGVRLQRKKKQSRSHDWSHDWSLKKVESHVGVVLSLTHQWLSLCDNRHTFGRGSRIPSEDKWTPCLSTWHTRHDHIYDSDAVSSDDVHELGRGEEGRGRGEGGEREGIGEL